MRPDQTKLTLALRIGKTQTVLKEGERIHLVDRKNRQYALTLKAGDMFQLSGETIAHALLIGKPDGTLVTLSRGRRLLALRRRCRNMS